MKQVDLELLSELEQDLRIIYNSAFNEPKGIWR